MVQRINTSNKCLAPWWSSTHHSWQNCIPTKPGPESCRSCEGIDSRRSMFTNVLTHHSGLILKPTLVWNLGTRPTVVNISESTSAPPYLYLETNLRDLWSSYGCCCLCCFSASAGAAPGAVQGELAFRPAGSPVCRRRPAGFRCVLLPPWLLDRHVEPRAPLGTCCDPLVSFPDNFSRMAKNFLGTRLGWGIFLQELSSIWKWGGLGGWCGPHSNLRGGSQILPWLGLQITCPTKLGP